MPYENLLKQRVIEPAKVSKEEIAEHLRVARHDASVAQNISSIISKRKAGTYLWSSHGIDSFFLLCRNQHPVGKWYFDAYLIELLLNAAA